MTARWLRRIKNLRGYEPPFVCTLQELMGDVANPKDPIVEEVHGIRRRLLEEYGGIDGYIRHIKELELELKDRVVRREPRKPVMTNRRRHERMRQGVCRRP